jgi:archaeosortase family protein ArtF
MRLSGEKKNVLTLGIYLTFFPLITLLIGSIVGEPLTRVEASNIHVLLETFGVKNYLIGNQLYIPTDRISFEIMWQCSGAFSITLYTLIYLFLPRLRRRLMEWVFGISVIYIANIIRVFVSLYLYHVAGIGAFNAFHYTIGPIVLFIIVIGLIAHAFLLGLKSSPLSP